jgi:uncharacterized protein
MSWRKHLQPDLILGDSVLNLTPDLLNHYNLKGLVLDVDETLVPTGMAHTSKELQQWVQEIRSVASLWLVSNNLSQMRIDRIATSLNVPYIFGARKPSRRKLRQAVVAMNIPPQQIGMVGDRLFTDVLAGNRLGMFTILVEPMINPAKQVRRHPVRNFEVWLSQVLGASLILTQHNVTKHNKT